MLIPPNKVVQVDSVEILYEDWFLTFELLRWMEKEFCESLKGVNHENVKNRYVYNLTVTGSYRMTTDS